MKKLVFFIVFISTIIGCKDKQPKKDPIPKERPVIRETKVDSTAYYKKLYEPYADKIDKKFSRLHKHTVFYGTVLFADKGRVFFEKAYGYKKRKNDPEVTLDNTFQLASVTKVFTAVATLMLYEQGKLDLKDSISKYFPGFPYDYNITIHDLLTHRSGLGKYTHFCDNPADIWPEKDCSIYNDDVIDIIYKIVPPLVSRPNRRFYYTNTNYILLASIIERVSGMKYREFVTKNIFEPLEMSSTKVYYRDNEGELINPVLGYESNFKPADDIYLNGCEGDKGIYSNVHDMLKFDRALHDNKLIKKETLELAMTGYSKPDRWKSRMNYGYGYRMIELPKTKEKVVYHTGWWRGFRTYFIRRVAKDQTIIILTNVKRGQFLKVSDLVDLLPDESPTN